MEDFDNSTISTDQGLIQVKPETSRDEQLAFIDTMRGIQSGQNQEIQDTTHALGSDVTPEFGGINGTSSYWLDRYQTPQTESRIATLRTAAQSSALNTALNNYLDRLQEDYNKAYRRASKRSRLRNNLNNPNNPNNPNNKGNNGDVEINGLKGGRADDVVGFNPNNKGQPRYGTAISAQGTWNGTPMQVTQDENGRTVWTGGNNDSDGKVSFNSGSRGTNLGWNPISAAVGSYFGPVAGIISGILGG